MESDNPYSPPPLPVPVPVLYFGPHQGRGWAPVATFSTIGRWHAANAILSRNGIAAKMGDTSPEGDTQMLVPLTELEWARENVGTDVDWEMFDDMALESEGVYVGMTSAGMAVDILEISACGYLSWRAHSNSDATNERVGEFAALVRSVRQNGSIATCRLIADHPEERADPTRDSRFRDVRIELNNKSIDFKLSVQLYFDWIESLRFDGVTLAEFVTIETYAELLIQFWADPLN